MIREKQLKKTDVEKMRVITNDRQIAEQIKSDSTLSVQGNLLRRKVENVVMNGSKVEKYGKVDKGHKLKRIVMNGVKTSKVGKLAMEALKAIIPIAANHRETFSIMHIDVSRAYFHAKAQRPVLIRLPWALTPGTWAQ